MRRYLEELLSQGRVRVVDREVSGRHELAAVTARSQRESDAPILFRHVAGSAYPVMTNIFGSRPRLTEMLGGGGSFCRSWVEMMATPLLPPVAVGEPDDLVEIRLTDLPQITYFEQDAGPYLTAGIFLANEPDSGVAEPVLPPRPDHQRHRIAHPPRQLAPSGAIPGQGGSARRGAGGGDPARAAAGAGAGRRGADPVRRKRAGGCRPASPARRSRMRRCRTVALDVPAETEIVIEGRILPHVRRPEGPFGEFMGFYVAVGDNHVFEVTAVIARRDAIFHALVCGSPEDMRLLELAVATRVYQALRAASLRGIIDVACVPTVMSTVVKIEQMYEGHAKQVMLTAMGANHDWNKSVFVVDDDVDIDDFNDVWWAYQTRGRADHRALVIPDIPGFYRDAKKDHWGRLGIDATVPFGRRDEFLRKRIPGADTLNLRDYFPTA